MNFEISTVGVIRSPFQQKFAIPRQPGLIKEIKAQLELIPPYNDPETLIGLEQFSHIWLIFVFHENLGRDWSAKVRPPRLGGNQRIGVFATRTTFRPNPLGLSVVEYHGYEVQDDRLLLNLSGADLVNGTPIIDIKPYIPYADSITNAMAGYASARPEASMKVEFEPLAMDQCREYQKLYPGLQGFISSVIALDPRPAYKKTQSSVQEYAVFLYNLNIKWRVENNVSSVTNIEIVRNQNNTNESY